MPEDSIDLRNSHRQISHLLVQSNEILMRYARSLGVSELDQTRQKSVSDITERNVHTITLFAVGATFMRKQEAELMSRNPCPSNMN